MLGLLWWQPTAALAGEAGGGRSDNNKRQLAQVIPGIPHPPQSQPDPALSVAKSVVRSAEPGHGTGSNPAHVKSQIQSVVSTPFRATTPEIRQAAVKGIVAAQGLSRVAARRFADIASWVSTVWRQLNETPRLTPNATPGITEPPVGPMRPLTDPGYKQQMYYTEEGRIKMVTGR